MRAVNLVPADERRGAGGAGGRSGGAAHILLGLLAVLVLAVSFYTLQKRSLAEKRVQLASVETQATSAESQAAGLTGFVQSASVRAARAQTVSSLAASRFDWSHALREVARVIPRNVWLTGLQGTVVPGTGLKSSAVSQTSALRGAIPGPAVELAGCTTDHDSVARMLTRMRLIDGVVRVALQSSAKGDGAGGGGDGDCRRGQARFPQFALVVFFDSATGSVPSLPTGAGRVAATQLGATGATGPTAPTGATGPAAAPIGVTP